MQGPPLPVKGCKIFDLRSVYKFKAIDHRSPVFVVSSEGPRHSVASYRLARLLLIRSVLSYLSLQCQSLTINELIQTSAVLEPQ